MQTGATTEGCPGLPNDGRQQSKGANADANTWKVVPMKDDPRLFKVVDSAGINVADRFHTNANAEQYVAHFVCSFRPAPAPTPTPQAKPEIHPVYSHWERARASHLPGQVPTLQASCPAGEELIGGTFNTKSQNVVILREGNHPTQPETWEVDAMGLILNERDHRGAFVQAIALCAKLDSVDVLPIGP